VDYLKDFIIHHQGLSVGNHQYEFEVNDRFFEHFEYSQLRHGMVQVALNLDKQERMMVLNFRFNGEVEVCCDRCGEEFMMPLNRSDYLIVKFGSEFQEENADVLIIPVSEYKFDVAPYIYEYLHLGLPSRIIHPDDAAGRTTCNTDILSRLEKMSPHVSDDSRWDALKKLNDTEESPNTLP
jgi:uncharacterized metal-binding protein YceD (DUF177 family)